jgi:hypothetical protein
VDAGAQAAQGDLSVVLALVTFGVLMLTKINPALLIVASAVGFVRVYQMARGSPVPVGF